MDISTNPKITGFTAAFLEDSGWYTVDPLRVAFTDYGYQRGCVMVTPGPTTCMVTRIPEYTLTVDEEYCTADFKSKGTAKDPLGTSFMDCKTIEKTLAGVTASVDCTDMNRQLAITDEKSTPQEYFGPDSRCFLSSYRSITSSETVPALLRPRCNRFRCDLSPLGALRLTLLFNNQAVACPFEGGEVDLLGDLKGKVRCPHTLRFCREVGGGECLGGCSGNGVCVQGGCVCYPGWAGADCNLFGMGVQKERCIWPLEGADCEIKVKDQCYFECGSWVLGWMVVVGLLVYYL